MTANRKRSTKAGVPGSAPTRKSRRPSWKVVSLVLASILVAAVLGEIAVRVVYGPKFRPRAVFGVGDAHLGWKPAPGLDNTFYGPDYSIHIRTDADGYRLGELGEVDYSKDLIVLLGDSYAFGWGLSTDDTFASRLDALMSRESGGKLRLVNLGVGGYGDLQNADRFEEFLRTHREARVRAVIDQHCMNDGVDNFRSLGYHLGRWEVEPVERPRSASHLVNLILYARMVSDRKSPGEATMLAGDPEGADMLWSYQRKGAVVTLPDSTMVGGQTIRLDKTTYPDNLRAADRMASLTSAQREIMAGAFNQLHAACTTRHITVVHTFIAGTPAWYVDEVSAIANASALAHNCRVVITGMVPSVDGSDRSIRNAHSGGHFNAKFSHFWAQRVAQILYESGAVPK